MNEGNGSANIASVLKRIIRSFKTTGILKREPNVCINVKHKSLELSLHTYYTAEVFVNQGAPPLPPLYHRGVRAEMSMMMMVVMKVQ